MDTAPVPLATHTHHDASSIPSTYYLRRKAHRLGISNKDFDACHTLGELQQLAKQRYRKLAKHFHPDKRAQQARQQASPNLTQGTPLRGAMFHYYADAYACLMKLPAHTMLHRRPKLGNYPRQLHDTQSIEPLPEREAILPLAMERRPLTLGFGWHETHL